MKGFYLNIGSSILLILLMLLAGLGFGWLAARGLQDGAINSGPATDSTTIKKALEKPPIETGQIVATVSNCKLYRLKTADNGSYIYWSICYDEKGNGISTSVK